MWFPGDPLERRWRRRDGAAALTGHIAGHLIREAWWRQTGEWIGTRYNTVNPVIGLAGQT
jgi:23S rRNA G2445 N2-methylase RlmL